MCFGHLGLGYRWAAGSSLTLLARRGAAGSPLPALWGPPWVVPAGTRSSHPGFLGDCCQVRNSKAEFIILKDYWRCSLPELTLDRAPAPC